MKDNVSRREFNVLLLSAAAATAVPSASATASRAVGDSEFRFVHPGMLQARADLDRMRAAVRQRQEPIFSGFEKLRTHPLSQLTYRSSGASAEIGRNPNIRFHEFDNDCNAAYQSAILWCVTQDQAYARQSMGLMDAWSAELRTISGADAVLCAALGGFKIANAAELLRHTDAGWPADRVERFNGMLREVFLPVIKNFAAFANGNWDTAAIKMMMAIAVFGDDRPLLDRAMVYYGDGCGDGRLTYYIYSSGECQESGRDQQHTQLGLGHMGDCCEVAWSQGLDLYGASQNRLLTGFEYTAKYNLGGDVPFTPDDDRTGKYHHSVISPRSALRPVYEQIWNHYVQRMGLAAPWTEKAAAQLRPAGAGPGADQTGFGTLLYSRPPSHAAAQSGGDRAPAAVHANSHTNSENGGIRVEFTALSSREEAAIERRVGNQKNFRTIARHVAGGSYLDRTVIAGQLYTYRVAGRSVASLPSSMMAGLPGGWECDNVGQLPSASAASFDGSVYRLSAAGGPRVDQGGGYAFLHRDMPKGSTLVARLLPLFASQFLQAGLALTAGDTECLLLLQPSGGPNERPFWSMCLLTRSDAQPASRLAATRLMAPEVSYGRVMQPLWLALETGDGTARAGFSQDGKQWTKLGSVPMSGQSARAGFALSSGIGAVTTELCFDSCSLLPTKDKGLLSGPPQVGPS